MVQLEIPRRGCVEGKEGCSRGGWWKRKEVGGNVCAEANGTWLVSVQRGHASTQQTAPVDGVILFS